MISIEAKAATRSTARSSSTPWKKRSGYAGYRLILGLVIMVLLYLMVSAQLSYNPHEASYAGASISSTAEMVPGRRQRGGHEENDVWSRGMEEHSSRKEEAKPRTEPATARLQGAQEKDEQEWADKNPIEEQSVGNERNSHNWEQTQQPADKDTVELEFGEEPMISSATRRSASTPSASWPATRVQAEAPLRRSRSSLCARRSGSGR